MGVCAMEDERNWFVGVDWASETHHVRVSDARGRKLGARAFAHSGEGLAAMAAWILEVTGAAPRGGLRGHRGAARPGRREPDGAWLPRSCDPSQAARSLPRPLLAGWRQG